MQDNTQRGTLFSWLWNNPMTGWLILTGASAAAYFRYHEVIAKVRVYTWADRTAVGLTLILVLGAVVLFARLLSVKWPTGAPGNEQEAQQTSRTGGSAQAVLSVLLLLALILLLSHRPPPQLLARASLPPKHPEAIQPVPSGIEEQMLPSQPKQAKQKRALEKPVTEAAPVTAPSPAAGGPQTPGQVAGAVTNEIPDVMDLSVGHPAESPLRVKDNVYWDDAVRTLNLGRARLQLLDGSLLNVGARSTMKIVKHDVQTQQTTIELTLGRVRAEVTKQTKPGSSFQIKTATAVIGVVGTILMLDARASETDTCVAEGVVSVQNVDPAVLGQLNVRPGECARVPRGLPPSAVALPAQMISMLTKLSAIPDPVAPVVADCVGNVSAVRRDLERRSLDRLNEVRRQNGASDCQWSDALADVARRHSCRMMALGFLDHVDPEYGELLQRLSTARLNTNNVAENVFQERGHDDPGRYSVDKLMTSPSHRRNMLDRVFRSCGVGVAVGEDGTFFSTHIFNAAVPSAVAEPGLAATVP
jgi:uncharacterized protein YkwD